VHEKVRAGRLVDEATLRFALAGVDDLFEEIRAARSALGSSGGVNVAKRMSPIGR
jgi:hypothetical protein